MIEEIALWLVFDVMGEERTNRTYEEYMRIAGELPPLKVLHHKVNQRLHELHNSADIVLPQLCRFKAGDKRIVYENYPKTISIETLRSALVISGMRSPRGRTK